MKSFNLIMLPALALCFSCRSISKKDMIVAAPGAKADKQQIWHRPTEVNYEFMNNCEAESSTSRLFAMFRTAGDPTKGGLSLPTFGASVGLDSNGKWAVARAVDATGADGMYVLRVEEESQVLFPIWTSKTKVKGRCLKLRTLGPISVERMSLDRNGYPPEATSSAKK